MRSKIFCAGCRTVLLYPRGATNVCCAICNMITPAPPGVDIAGGSLLIPLKLQEMATQGSLFLYIDLEGSRHLHHHLLTWHHLSLTVKQSSCIIPGALPLGLRGGVGSHSLGASLQAVAVFLHVDVRGQHQGRAYCEAALLLLPC
ncbi:uncharacterized protein LOC131026351 isoform X5 [Salvia miltiorrhiza]|nr:uncharacterized protein LOC131026351 isoform X5 [Salvia miltiorrhiza]XP_057812196.1 uncharacterized protein LOC131026351 isoform X5 [Salvia miltiorrhiza]